MSWLLETMRISGLSRVALFASNLAIAACSQATTPSGFQYNPNVNVAYRRANPSRYRVLYSFGASGDGIVPSAGLIDVQGTLLGTEGTALNRTQASSC
jgi:hypothetical protein